MGSGVEVDQRLAGRINGRNGEGRAVEGLGAGAVGDLGDLLGVEALAVEDGGVDEGRGDGEVVRDAEGERVAGMVGDGEAGKAGAGEKRRREEKGKEYLLSVVRPKPRELSV